MASTRQGVRLTEEHRRAQIENQAAFLGEYIEAWPLLDQRRLDETSPGWLRAVLRLLGLYRQRSANLTADYYRDFRLLEAPAADVPVPVVEYVQPEIVTTIDPPEWRAHRGNRGVEPVDLPEPDRPGRLQRQTRLVLDWGEDDKAAATSLIVTGPVNIKTQTKAGRGVQIVNRNALVETAGAASRHMLNGGRRVGVGLAEADKMTLGWVRVTDEDPCWFCAMLASRGPKYKETSFDRSDPRFEGPGEFKAHDHCACTLEPVYSRTAAWPGQSKQLQKLWNDNIKGNYSGKEAMRAWRDLYEGRKTDRSAPGSRSRTRDVVTEAVSVDFSTRRRQLEAEIAALEPVFESLKQRKERGEDVDAPYTYQRDRLRKLKAELAEMKRVAA